MEIYGQLSMGRGGNGFGISPITWADLHAWQQLHGVSLSSWEASTIFHLDRAIRAVMSKD